MAARDEAAKRAALFASRPDWTAEFRTALAGASVQTIEALVKSAPKGPVNPKAAAQVAASTATRGADQTEEGASGATDDEKAFIARSMGRSQAGMGVVRKGRDLILGYMTPAQAAAHVAKLNAAKAKEGV